MEQLDGMFWQIDTPDRRTAGQLVIGGDENPTLVTERAIYTEGRFSYSRSAYGGVTIAYSADPEDHVADFEERTIHGELADGTPVTLVHAQGGSRSLEFLLGPDSASQQFHARYALIGQLVTPNQPYRAVRFRLVGPTWRDVTEEQAHSADGGQLRTYRGGDGSRWIEFTGSKSMTFRDINYGVINAVKTLTQLATSNPAADVDVQVQLDGANTPWGEVKRARESLKENGRPLLDPRHLTAERLTAWIDFRRETEGLDAAVLDDMSGIAIQTQVLALTAVAEGLHRRLFVGKLKRVKVLSDSKIAKMRRLARVAAVAKMEGSDFSHEDRAEFGRAINEAFGHINEQTFRCRMDDLITDARRAIPSLGAGFADWPDAVSTARNLMVHQPSLPDGVEHGQVLDLLMALLQEQVTSEMACPGGWAGRMLLCPGRTPESSVTMLSGSPVTVRTG